MKLTNEQIEQMLDDAPEGATHIDEDERYWRFEVRNGQSFLDVFEWYWQEMNACLSEMFSLENLREILALRKELEQTKKELEAVINEESDGVNGVV